MIDGVIRFFLVDFCLWRVDRGLNVQNLVLRRTEMNSGIRQWFKQIAKYLKSKNLKNFKKP